MALASQMPPPLTTGLMSHARLPHVARGPCGSLSGVRGNQAQAALKAEQDMKKRAVGRGLSHKTFGPRCWQNREQRFFSPRNGSSLSSNRANR
nr:protein PRRC2C-like [Castor canadensis]